MAFQILCASSLAHGAEVFSSLGEVTVIPDAELSRTHAASADALITRSKTQLGPELLEGTQVRFAGTATAGVDHADQPWLEQAGIHFSSAPGCNANSVGEYVIAALFAKIGPALSGRVLGIVGHGNVGKNVAAKARALGMEVLLNDPPLAEAGQDPTYQELDEVCAAADLLTLHVPLVEEGRHPTRHLIGARQLELLGPEGWLINACRGEVIDAPLLEQRLERDLAGAVLDVWDPEPAFPDTLLNRTALGTAHIAGYSFEGKFNGTLQIYEALCEFLGRANERNRFEREFRVIEGHRIPADTLRSLEDEAAVAHCVRQAYDIEADDRLLREAAGWDDDARASWFRKLRSGYRRRDEFPALSVEVPQGRDALGEILERLGFAT